MCAWQVSNAVSAMPGIKIIGTKREPKQKGINIISIVLDAPADVISTLSGKIGMLKGVSVKALYAKAPQEQPF